MSDGNAASRMKAQVGVSRPTAQRMWILCAFAFLAAVQSAMGDFGSSAYAALAALAAALAAEFLITRGRHGLSKVSDGSAAASAMALALMLPNDISPMNAALGALFAVAIAKHSFGGLGSNWMNPALAGWLFVRYSWPAAFARPIEARGADALGAASAADFAVRDFLNRVVLAPFGAELPAGYIDVFWARAPGIVADRAALAMLLLVAALFAFRASRMLAPLAYVAVFGFLARMLGAIPDGGALWEGDVLLALLSGGTLVAAFVLLAEPSSGAKSAGGALAAAILAAGLSVLFRFFGGEFYGGFFAVALVNALMPLLRAVERRLLYARASEARALLGTRLLIEGPRPAEGPATPDARLLKEDRHG